LTDAGLWGNNAVNDETPDRGAAEQDDEFRARVTMEAANAGDWLAKIWGKWPGDETIDELLEELAEMKCPPTP
jgi:hypothetical protein